MKAVQLLLAILICLSTPLSTLASDIRTLIQDTTKERSP